MSNYPKVVEQIHNEFNIAGERLLQESLQIIENAEKVDVEKAQRLNNMGFSNASELKKALSIAESIKNPAEMAAIVMEYKQKYPLHKFISDNDIDIICTKYKLVRGSTEQYTAFVPDKNLRDIEAFKVKTQRCYINEIVFSYKNGDSKKIKEYTEKLKSQNQVVIFEPDSYYNITKYLENKFWDNQYLSIYKVDSKVISSFDICAPQKDMITAKKHNALMGLFELKVSVNPDPVVLYPVKHGAIIVTAWGDEASDPLVANENMN